MKRSGVAAMLLLLLAWVCFLSTSVFAELPWDADSNDGGSGGGTDGGSQDTDTTDFDDPTAPVTSQGDGWPYWLANLMSGYTAPAVFYPLLSFAWGADGVAATATSGGSTPSTAH